MQLVLSDRDYVIVRFAIYLDLPKADFQQEAEDIHNQWFEVWYHE
jgi:hypothetical protein